MANGDWWWNAMERGGREEEEGDVKGMSGDVDDNRRLGCAESDVSRARSSKTGFSAIPKPLSGLVLVFLVSL